MDDTDDSMANAPPPWVPLRQLVATVERERGINRRDAARVLRAAISADKIRYEVYANESEKQLIIEKSSFYYPARAPFFLPLKLTEIGGWEAVNWNLGQIGDREIVIDWLDCLEYIQNYRDLFAPANANAGPKNRSNIAIIDFSYGDNEEKCRDWLIKVYQNRHAIPAPNRDELYLEAQIKFPGIGRTKFLRARNAAIDATGAHDEKKPGRPRRN